MNYSSDIKNMGGAGLTGGVNTAGGFAAPVQTIPMMLQDTSRGLEELRRALLELKVKLAVVCLPEVPTTTSGNVNDRQTRPDPFFVIDTIAQQRDDISQMLEMVSHLHSRIAL